MDVRLVEQFADPENTCYAERVQEYLTLYYKLELPENEKPIYLEPKQKKTPKSPDMTGNGYLVWLKYTKQTQYPMMMILNTKKEDEDPEKFRFLFPKR